MTSRSLPARRNPHVVPDDAPSHNKLVSTRRLGRTKLTVDPRRVGTSNATKAENLGTVEYAHLQAPLPEDLEGSEMFARPKDAESDEALGQQKTTSYPTSYFFMRRSKDGYVSATSMFKIAFPWALEIEHKTETEYLYTLETTAADEMAGNIWISPEHALELAEEYGLSVWIRALLDPADIAQSRGTAKKPAAEPPKFRPSLDESVKIYPPSESDTPARSTRSMSPSKGLAPAPASTTKTKSPRKRQTKAQKEASLAEASAAAASLQATLDEVAPIAEVVAENPDVEAIITQEVVTEADPEAEVLEAELTEENGSSSAVEHVKVEVEQAVELTNGTEVTHTNVTVSMPVGLADLPLPEDTESMLEKAKQMVEEAKALEGAPKLSKKRKAEEVELSDIDKELPAQPAKKARVLEEKLKRERVRTRALVGVGAMLGIAAAIPYFF